MVRIQKVRWGLVQGLVWTDSGMLGSFDSTPVPETRQARVDLLPPGTATVHVEFQSAPQSGFRVVVCDAAYGLAPHEARDLARAVSWHPRVAERDLPSFGTLSIGSLWPASYRLEVLAPHGAVVASAEFSVRPREHTEVRVRPQSALASLRLVSRLPAPGRVALLSGATGLVGRWVLGPGETRTVDMLVPGDFELVDLQPSELAPVLGRQVTLEAGRQAEVVLIPGWSSSR